MTLSSIPPKRSLKIQKKLEYLSNIQRYGRHRISAPTEWRHAILTHERENKSKFTIRNDGKNYWIYRER